MFAWLSLIALLTSIVGFVALTLFSRVWGMVAMKYGAGLFVLFFVLAFAGA